MKPRSRRERVLHARSCAAAIKAYQRGQMGGLYLRDILAQSISPNGESGQSVYSMEARKTIKRAVDVLAGTVPSTAAGEADVLSEARATYMGVRK